MPYEPRPGDFTLSKNDRKEQPNHPDYKGSGIAPDGTPCWISAWIKQGQNGKFLSLSIKPKEERASREDSFRRGGDDRMAGGGRDVPRAGADDFDEAPF